MSMLARVLELNKLVEIEAEHTCRSGGEMEYAWKCGTLMGILESIPSTNDNVAWVDRQIEQMKQRIQEDSK